MISCGRTLRRQIITLGHRFLCIISSPTNRPLNFTQCIFYLNLVYIYYIIYTAMRIESALCVFPNLLYRENCHLFRVAHTAHCCSKINGLHNFCSVYPIPRVPRMFIINKFTTITNQLRRRSKYHYHLWNGFCHANYVHA